MDLARDVFENGFGCGSDWVQTLVFDIYSRLDFWGGDTLEYGEEAATKGAEAFRGFFSKKDSSAEAELFLLLNGKWKDVRLKLGQ